MNEKILKYEQATAIIEGIKGSGKKVVQCHGTFDLLHPGHIVHFQEAKELGDCLIVTITGEKFVNKGPGRPFFNDEMRVRFLSSLSCVDYVIVIPYAAAVEAIECVKPHIYCKGKEYEEVSVDPTGNILDDIRTVKKHGGEMAYVGSVVFSSTRLLNNHFDTHGHEIKSFCRNLSKTYPPEKFRECVEGLAGLKVLLVGDIIFDKYNTVSVQGLTSKNRILSTRYKDSCLQTGGVFAVYKHIKQFVDSVKLVSLLGTEGWVEPYSRQHIEQDDDYIIRSENFQTVVKERFVESVGEGHELSKLFSVNWIDEDVPSEDVVERLHKTISDNIEDCDVVVVMDFGHGVMTDTIRELVQDKAPLLAVNCQTNSNNYGFNIINRQYRRADLLSLDNGEMMLACGKRHFDKIKEFQSLSQSLGAKFAWLTGGAEPTIGCSPAATCDLAAFENEVIDTVGAGDAFCSIAFLAAAKGYPIELSTFMGQLAGAQAVRIVGNTAPLCKATLIKGGTAMLNF